MKKISYKQIKHFTKGKPEFTKIKAKDVVNNSNAILNKIMIGKELVLFVMKIKIVINMLKAYCKKTYTKVPKKTITALSFALVYAFSPVDAIPDNIPVVGYVDDAKVLQEVLKSANKDIKDYEEWEKQRIA